MHGWTCAGFVDLPPSRGLLLAALLLAACGAEPGLGDTLTDDTLPGDSLTNNGSLTNTSLSGADTDDTDTDDGGTGPGTGGSGVSGASNGSGGSNDTIKFDVGDGQDSHGTTTGDDPCDTDGTDGCECTIPEHTPCDAGTFDPFYAMGLNCPGEFQVNASTNGAPSAIGVRSSFGGSNAFDPREGSVYAVIGSGHIADLDLVTPGGDSNAGPTHCNDDLGNYDPGGSLPAPILTNDVGGDCTQNAGLIGTGDCSNTINGQFTQGGSANDYTELRVVANVPPDVTSFSYDFAFFTTEWPWYANSAFNDMYIGWLTSELWTGNISFDNQGNPISLNAGFLDYKDQNGTLNVFAGTCMRQHAGTAWLSTTASVSPGESITLVFAIFDLSDSILDSYAFLDNFQWGCEPTGKPSTEPIG
ncbi:MAG: choice-of-anchor L domain-containing protein [Ilumatobacter sp.]|nr:choice-of-anchor L domain-containing protein [Ilumatobacter sp.]MCB9749441.1 choice-of-anchor L domain-containing protein [Myxococcales bacterium]